jgi:hypothetical protein
MSNQTIGARGVTRAKLLPFALIAVGAGFLLIYPLAFVWPSGWAWHEGAPHDSQYFMMIVGVYATLGVFLTLAARNPAAHASLIWFTVWSSAVHGLIMAVQALSRPEYMIHLFTDAGAMLLSAVVLGLLAPRGQAA